MDNMPASAPSTGLVYDAGTKYVVSSDYIGTLYTYDYTNVGTGGVLNNPTQTSTKVQSNAANSVTVMHLISKSGSTGNYVIGYSLGSLYYFTLADNSNALGTPKAYTAHSASIVEILYINISTSLLATGDTSGVIKVHNYLT
jgi:hypothetical protein